MRRRNGERGAVLVLVAVFMIVAVVMVAAVVDLGGQRAERKEVTLSTDAAALAAAALADTEDIDLVSVALGTLVDCGSVGISMHAVNPEGFSNVQQAVDDYLTRNGDSNPVDCKVARTSFREGYVIVAADEIVDYAIGPALGIDSGEVNGVSVAAIEANPGGGLRPVGICGAMVSMAGVSGYPEVSLNALATTGSGGFELDASGNVVSTSAPTTPTTFTARFPIEHVKGGSCNATTGPSGSGNFGKLDFGGATSTSCTEIGHFCKDYADGYYGTVSNPTKGDTGNNWSNSQTESSTENLEDHVGQFWAPVYSVATGTGNNANFVLTHFAQMEMVNHCFSGSCKFDGTTWFDFRVSKMIPYLPAGPPSTDDADERPPRLCAVVNDAAKIAAGCPQLVSTVTTLPPASSTTSSSTTSSSTSSTTSTAPTTTTTAPQCAATAVSPASGHALKNGSAQQLDWTVTVANEADCTNVSAYLDRRNGSGDLTLTVVGLSGNQLTVRLPATTVGANNQVYDLVVSVGSPARQIVGAQGQPSSTLTMTN
ncbi:MAG: pilus assembly protein TadG-related protein [Acidimicrobiia bacterium]